MSKSDDRQTPESPDRRSFVKKATYVAPAIMTLPAMPSIAQSGSGGGDTLPDPRNQQGVRNP